ncbi:hypothetical protein FACS189472_14850 [Alphaproteobacteria bacterium]|nr:hypothetical protein FACS189472_14850 [Alphaproteobacteria bacterium]
MDGTSESCEKLKDEGDKLFKNKDFVRSLFKYEKALSQLLGEENHIENENSVVRKSLQSTLRKKIVKACERINDNRNKPRILELKRIIRECDDCMLNIFNPYFILKYVMSSS